AVDAALHRMVKSEFIIRLARGVFVRDDSQSPSLTEIAQAKAKAFKATIVNYSETLVKPLRKWAGGRKESEGEATFAKIGYSSSFWTVRGRVYVKGICTRKMHLTQSKVGSLVLSLWQWGRR